MREITGNIWDYWGPGKWIGITTNGTVKQTGACVMGAGVALEAAKRFPLLPKIIGDGLKNYGNQPLIVRDYWIVSCPVKFQWFQDADLSLIRQTAQILREALYSEDISARLIPRQAFYTVRWGCGNGKLKWTQVKPILDEFFPPPPFGEPERFFVVEKP